MGSTDSRHARSKLPYRVDVDSHKGFFNMDCMEDECTTRISICESNKCSQNCGHIWIPNLERPELKILICQPCYKNNRHCREVEQEESDSESDYDLEEFKKTGNVQHVLSAH